MKNNCQSQFKVQIIINNVLQVNFLNVINSWSWIFSLIFTQLKYYTIKLLRVILNALVTSHWRLQVHNRKIPPNWKSPLHLYISLTLLKIKEWKLNTFNLSWVSIACLKFKWHFKMDFLWKATMSAKYAVNVITWKEFHSNFITKFTGLYYSL
jgi:hypothetical protein